MFVTSFFYLRQVRFGTHKRFQDWFQRQYLFTPESQSLRCDLIRFIVGVIHPTNELLCSDIIPRWAVIGWLLTTCTSQVAGSNAKLALFYDWLFFDPEKDNIMNIEPAILVMNHSMRPHPAITATLLDFLCRIIMNFTLGREQEKVKQERKSKDKPEAFIADDVRIWTECLRSTFLTWTIMDIIKLPSGVNLGERTTSFYVICLRRQRRPREVHRSEEGW